MRRTKEEAAATRQAVLDAALIVFSDKGYAAANLEDIARQAGVTRGAVYWHFEDKADLYHTLVGEIPQRLTLAIEGAMAEGGSYRERLRRLLVESLVDLERDARYRLIIELTLFKSAHPELADGLRRKSEGTRAAINGLADFLRAGVETGELRRDLDVKAAAAALVSLHNGLTMTWLLAEQAFSLRQSAEAAAEVFLRGI